MKILIVDDNKNNLYFLESLLKGFEYEVVTAINGKDALEKLQSESFNMIISDILMPEMDGFQLLRSVKLDNNLRDLPFIFYTATYTDDKDKEFGLKLGACEYLMKPIDPEELIKIVQYIFNDCESGRLKSTKPVLDETEEIYKIYNSRLVKKLEHKMLALEKEITKRKQADEALLKLSTAVTQSPSVITITDLKGNIEYINPKFTELTGYSSEETLGKNSRILKSGELTNEIYKELWNTISSGKEWHGEFHNKKKDGELFWEAASISPIIDKKGKIINYVKVAKDITEQKQTEELLRENEEQYRAVVENSHNGIAIIGEDYKFNYVNNKLCEVFGRKSKEIIGNDFRGFLDEESKQLVGDRYKKRQQGEEVPSNYEFTVVRKDGEKRRVEINFVVVEDSKSRKRTIAQLLDITEHKKAELELRQSEQRFKSLFEDLGDAVFVTKVGGLEKGQILEVNSAATKQTGYSKDELLQMNIASDLSVPDSGDISKNDWDELLQIGKTVTTTEKKRRKDGTEFWTDVIVTPIEFNGEKASLSISHDITERIQAEIDLKSALEKATESDRLKSAFLATMSHELRTPLNAIIGFSDLIDKDLPVEEMIGFVRTINSSGEHLLSIVEDLFDITLIESGEININKSSFNLISALKDINEIMRAEQQALQKENISLNLIYPPKNNDLIIATDLPKLKQILINLVKNALKFTHEGQIEYGYNIETEKDKPVLEFFVKDTGIGISENMQELIFEIFRQIEDSHTRTYGGTGIGLSIAKRLTELLGGRIWLESEVGKGSTFYFSIPYAKPESNDKFVDLEQSIEKISISEENKTIKKRTILIVEDDIASCELLKILLNNSGISTIWAKGGKESISFCKENSQIDLILMDINMLVMNGYEATKEIKKICPELPIIAQTAYAIAGDREKAIDAGCDDYITKPIQKELLMEMIEVYLEK